jgi:5-methyltetrahydrofolate--homocysteine methyltransferase
MARKNLALNGTAMFDKVLYLAEYARNEINGIGGYYAFSSEIKGKAVGDFDRTKLSINTIKLGLAGFEVYDIGIDQPPQSFIDKINETGAGIVGLSGLLTLAFDSMKVTVEAMKDAGVRDKVKIMIGGSVTNENVRQDMGADFWGRDATAAVEIAREVCR